jgi:hypothetical protein
MLKGLNILLALLTLLLIATAFSKMAMYIGVYGLSIRRLLPCVFMAFLALVCGGVVALQKWEFSIMRFSVSAGAVMLCACCLLNPVVLWRDTSRQVSVGKLKNFDTAILYKAGSAGVARR